MQNPHLRRISALCAARSLAYLYDMSALAVLLRLELHPHLGVLQRSQPKIKKQMFQHLLFYKPS
ncbi:lipoprotein signal peptidase [Neisseria sp. 74A18]|uniref:lipoprotein signal peptidase n=1 Tax=Neisseria sp. 74A18 TaxID=1696094 RepID=UPI000AFF650D|nr:lipoprotein signal peptidase [Neisseria sp. 74A18]